MSSLSKFLDEVDTTINGDRRTDYGSPDESFNRIATFWTAYLGFPITSRDVANLMILLKVGRDKHNPKHDNQIDIAGYAALADSISEGHGPADPPIVSPRSMEGPSNGTLAQEIQADSTSESSCPSDIETSKQLVQVNCKICGKTLNVPLSMKNNRHYCYECGKQLNALGDKNVKNKTV